MHGFSMLTSPVHVELSATLLLVLVVVAIWTIVLKGYALWFAARDNQKWWFIALLVINTLGILEIAYLIWFRPDNKNSSVVASSTPPAIPVVSITPEHDSKESEQA